MSWTTVRSQQGERGVVELRRWESGRGRAKFVTWKIFCEGVQVDYAAAERDVEDNFRAALRGDFRYEPAGPCPAGQDCSGQAFAGHPAHPHA